MGTRSAWAGAKEEVAAAGEKWAAIFVDDNPDAILALYDDEAVLWGTLSSTRLSGKRVLWHCLLHVVNHGTQHRSEAAAILTGYGYSPGGLDFTMFLNEQH